MLLVTDVVNVEILVELVVILVELFPANVVNVEITVVLLVTDVVSVLILVELVVILPVLVAISVELFPANVVNEVISVVLLVTVEVNVTVSTISFPFIKIVPEISKFPDISTLFLKIADLLIIT